MSSITVVAIAKVGMVEDATNQETLINIFKDVPMLQSTRCAPGVEWRCNHWVRDAVGLLAQKGWSQVKDVDQFWKNFKDAALPYRDLRAGGQGSCEVLDVALT
ncbi:hypothetical protein NEOLEDRAFT_651979 [Neolentinus lepideus HHB14362 ss-1]|uniref:Uncharacterized protein n=1 Tax=Neolentinus lepideus HHB14362 ss-1 TaxID=1314782 RepID=A0A165QJI6_9AGAM|nr:hypothetical protein NEOLEDRAFT_651979 [Neolentinus lepideus HHB14362 ss-1]